MSDAITDEPGKIWKVTGPNSMSDPRREPATVDHEGLARTYDGQRANWGAHWRKAVRGVTEASLLAVAHSVLDWNDKATHLHVAASDQGDFLAWSYIVLEGGEQIDDGLDEDPLGEDLYDLLADVDTESGTAREVWQHPDFCEIKNDHGGYYAFDLHKLIAHFEKN